MWCSATICLFLLLQGTDPIAQGMKALDANQFDRAVQLFTQAIAANPNDYSAHFNLALAYSLSNKDADAIPEYRKTLEIKPDLYQAHLNLGMLLLRDKQPKDAVTPLEFAAAAKPLEFRPQFYAAEAELGAGEFEKAETHYHAALAADPKSAAAELGLGRAQIKLNRIEEGAAHVRKAAEMDAKFRDGLLELAAAFEKAGKPGDAIEIYEQFPSNPGAQERMGELLIESKRFAEAIPRLEKVVAESPTSANRLALATAYRMNKEPQKEIAELRKAAASDPANYDLHMIFGRTLRDERQLGPAADQFYQAAKIQAQSKEAWNELAGVLIVKQDYANGLAALDRVKALGEETPGNHYLRAITLDKLKQLKPALESYQKFLATSKGKFPDQEFIARQRVRIIQNELSKK
ncbi:MAG: tetratricopeptide repeat protein [Acidobacteriota bacterium]|nr:tetratricopeptide repeat protein [Acidobacteriota bacterium]